MRVQVDESGSDHQPRRVDHPFCTTEPPPYGRYSAIHNCHIGDLIHPARGIHNSAATDHQATHLTPPMSLLSP
jgi:hypothetical protein